MRGNAESSTVLQLTPVGEVRRPLETPILQAGQ